MVAKKYHRCNCYSGLYESLDLSSLKNTDTIKITYETTCFELSSMYSVITPKLVDSSDLKYLINWIHYMKNLMN